MKLNKYSYYKYLPAVREDESIRPDMAPDDPAATQEQNDSSIEITLKNFQSENVSWDVSISVRKIALIFVPTQFLKPP